jgi:methylase of polypeptide subunit release factors
VIHQYLDEMRYALVDFRLSFEVGLSPTGFPKFELLQQIVRRLDPAHQVLFRLFRLGEAVDNTSVRSTVPDQIFTILVDTGILVRDEADGWRTPSLLIVPAEGLSLLVGIPPSYPTSTRSSSSWFDLSSYVVAKALPSSLADQRVLDVCSGSGIQALLCSARGAIHVVGLELNEDAVTMARANAMLNGFDGKVEFRQSDKLASLHDGERFDFIVCNTAYAPVLEETDAPLTPEAIGNSVLMQFLDKLPLHLSEHSHGLLATWRAIGYRSSTYQMQAITSRLGQAGFSASAYVDRAPDTVDGVLHILQTDLEQRLGMQLEQAEEIVKSVGELLQRAEFPVDGFYNQLIYFQKGKIESAATEHAIFGLSAPTSAEEAR